MNIRLIVIPVALMLAGLILLTPSTSTLEAQDAAKKDKPSPANVVAAPGDQGAAADPRERIGLLTQSIIMAADWDAAKAEAKKAGEMQVEQRFADEALIMFAIRNRDTAAMKELAPSMAELRKNYNSEAISLIFESEDQFKGILLLVDALVAKADGDDAGYKKNLLDAFWANPEQAAIYGSIEAASRADERMAAKLENLRMPLDTKIATSGGKETTLGDLVKGKKGLLIDFWASWCGPCMQAMPELKKKAEELDPKGVVVVGMNAGEDAKTAEEVRTSQKIDFPWLLEPGDSPFSKLLEIDSIPRAIVMTPEGKVLFNGHPMSPDLNAALAALQGEKSGS